MWVDDEVEQLRAHLMFLEKKGYEVITVTNGTDAIDQVKENNFDLVLLDEQMPGLSGLETLQKLKELQPSLPVIMVTKSEEENIMEQAIGQKIADYLIKPVNPNQILLALKKNIHRKEIETEVTQSQYQQNFQQIAMQIMDCQSWKDWSDIYKRLVHWELELSATDSSMKEMLQMQKEDANNGFGKFIKKHYLDWIEDISNPKNDKDASRPILSPEVFKTKVFPLLNEHRKVFLIVLDNFRYDQWRILAHELSEQFDIDEELYSSILPTATQYARNAIFSGLMPLQIQEMFPDYWVEEGDEESKNQYEKELVQTLLDRYRRRERFNYWKVNESDFCERVIHQLKGAQAPLNIVVLNFIDMLSHSRTESKMMRELANDEAAYRSLTISWFKHSPTYELLRRASELGFTVVLTTDHGTTRVKNAVQIIADKNTNTNIRYKVGKALNCSSKNVFTIEHPKRVGLPCPNVSSSYAFCTGSDFFAYPNQFNYYAQYYRNTFQHGGISLEEMIIPLVTLSPKK